jgi:hypothetical protein
MKEKKTKEKFVVTINNESLPISKCRRYESGFYKIGDINIENSGDCYLLEDGKYYRSETEQIVYNHSINKYVFKTSSLIKGIVNENSDLGYFEKSIYNVTVNDLTCQQVAINKKVLENNRNYRECYTDNRYYHISKLKAKKFYELYNVTSDYKNSLPYNASVVLSEYITAYEENYVEKQEISQDILKLIKNYSFGFEFETIKGRLSRNICKQLGVIPLRDGSIRGLEYVTIPLTGSKGINSLIEVVEELNLKTQHDDTCSLHLHIGNIPRTPSFILAFYRLTCLIQDEIFELFPLYKKYNFGFKNKNYAAPYDVLKNAIKMDYVIDETNMIKNFDILFQELSEGHPLRSFNDKGDLSNIHFHPKDPSGNQKWNINTR